MTLLLNEVGPDLLLLVRFTAEDHQVFVAVAIFTVAAVAVATIVIVQPPEGIPTEGNPWPLNTNLVNRLLRQRRAPGKEVPHAPRHAHESILSVDNVLHGLVLQAGEVAGSAVNLRQQRLPDEIAHEERAEGVSHRV